jgi:hypothetical protein
MLPLPPVAAMMISENRRSSKASGGRDDCESATKLMLRERLRELSTSARNDIMSETGEKREAARLEIAMRERISDVLSERFVSPPDRICEALCCPSISVACFQCFGYLPAQARRKVRSFMGQREYSGY